MRALVRLSRVSPKRDPLPILSVTKVKNNVFRSFKNCFISCSYDTGSGLLEILKDAVQNLGVIDVRYIGGGESVLDQIKSFHTAALQFDLNENGSRRQFVLRSITRFHRQLTQDLAKPWNVSLASRGEKLTVETQGSGSASGSNDKIKFRLATPLKEKTSFTCSDCGTNFSSWRGYKNHVKKKHNKVVEGQGPKVTCLLPHGRGTRVTDKHSMDQICSHLLLVHKIAKPTKNHEFRGFKSLDGEKTWEPVFLLDTDPDPSMDSLHGSNSASTKVNRVLNFDTDDKVVDKAPEDELQQGTSSSSSSTNCKVSCTAATFGASSTIIQPFHQDTDMTPAERIDSMQTAEEELIRVELIVDTEDNENLGERVEPETEKPVALDWEVDDEICASFEEHLMDSEKEEYPSEFSLALDDGDSDIESEDTAIFTKQRLQTKKDRYAERRHLTPEHPANTERNKAFIEDFVKMVIRYSKSKNEKSSTIDLSTALLFRHPDSFLLHQIKKNPTFSLDKLLSFQDEASFVELKDPSSWIDEIGGENGKENPIRRKEMYKAYKRLILFVLRRLSQENFSTDLLSLLRRDKIKSNLKEISEEINASKTWTNLQSLIDQNSKEVAKAKNVVNPDESFNASQGNVKYFNSEEFKTRLEKNNKIWEKCNETQTVGAKEFDTIGQFARHLLTMTDRNRAGGYWFRNSHFASRRSVWFPPDHNKTKFDGVPKNWNMHTQPADGRQPDAWTIDLSGSTEVVKMGEDVHITILRMADDWMQKYRDLKILKWGTLKDDEYFFVNNKRKRFGPLLNTAQLKEYASVTGTSKATTNTFRKAMEPAIQSDEALKTRSKAISSHSESTGAKYYDSSAPAFRASALHYINDGEFEYEATQVSEEVVAKRQKLDEEGQKFSHDQAQGRIQKDPSKRNATLGKNCKVDPRSRVYMQRAFSKDGVFSGLRLFDGKFPGKYFCLLLYIFNLIHYSLR